MGSVAREYIGIDVLPAGYTARLSIRDEFVEDSFVSFSGGRLDAPRRPRLFEVPPGTRYLGVMVTADENIVDDPPLDQLDGHFADNVMLTLVPEPKIYGLCLMAALCVACTDVLLAFNLRIGRFANVGSITTKAVF